MTDSTKQIEGDAADRKAFVERVAMGQDPEDVAKELGIPERLAGQWIGDCVVLAEMAEFQALIRSSALAHGSALLALAAQQVERALNDEIEAEKPATRIAMKLLVASGLLHVSVSGEAASLLEARVATEELRDRLAQLKRFRELGGTEPDYWFLVTGSPNTPSGKARSATGRRTRKTG